MLATKKKKKTGKKRVAVASVPSPKTPDNIVETVEALDMMFPDLPELQVVENSSSTLESPAMEDVLMVQTEFDHVSVSESVDSSPSPVVLEETPISSPKQEEIESVEQFPSLDIVPSAPVQVEQAPPAIVYPKVPVVESCEEKTTPPELSCYVNYEAAALQDEIVLFSQRRRQLIARPNEFYKLVEAFLYADFNLRMVQGRIRSKQLMIKDKIDSGRCDLVVNCIRSSRFNSLDGQYIHRSRKSHMWRSNGGQRLLELPNRGISSRYLR